MEALTTFINKVGAAIISPLITLVALLAFVFFVWGVVEFIANAGDEDKRKTGRQHIIWGLVGLAVLFGAQTIIEIMKNSIGQ